MNPAERLLFPLLSEKLGRYRLMRQIGGGGMGAVYEAEDTVLGRRVALKVPHLDSDDRTKVFKRFLQEATIASSLDHPNICRVYDFGEIDGVPYLVMPFLDGTTLDRRFQHDHPWPVREAVELVRTVALALQVIHDRGAIHRDLKPANIMLQDGQPIILDFGLARATGRTKGLTTTGRAVGTPAYISPEQLAQAEEAREPGCDIYSLGVILYELLTGQLPFTGENLHQVYYQILNVPPPPPSARQPGCGPALDSICLKALAKKPEDRYGTMAEFAAALEVYLQQEQAASRPKEERRRRRQGKRPLQAGAGDGWYLVYQDEKGASHTVKGTTAAIRRSLRDGLLGDASNVRVSRSRLGPFEPLGSSPPFRDLDVGPAPLTLPPAAATPPVPGPAGLVPLEDKKPEALKQHLTNVSDSRVEWLKWLILLVIGVGTATLTFFLLSSR
jgi:serine/threonine protein kinase